ncbi:CBS domain-containing protein [Catellatospora bangladeshensis]|uniref:CBS domain-containing protein n=1 Tax=Catellatospora bangladeshensis TaxID=310355 RepID=UPI0036177D03
MSRDVVSGALDTPYADIADLQTRHRLNAVPVLDDLHWLAGVVSEGDLLRRVRSTSPSGPSSTTPRSGTSTRGPCHQRPPRKGSGPRTCAGETGPDDAGTAPTPAGVRRGRPRRALAHDSDEL